MTLAEKIIEKFESSGTDWREGASGSRNLRIQQKELDEIGKAALVAEAEEMKEKGLLRIKWLVVKSDIESVNYRLEDVPRIYEQLGRVPKALRIGKLEKLAGTQRDLMKKEWIKAHYEALLKQIRKGKEEDFLNEKNRDLYFACFAGLDKLAEPVYKRIFSKQNLMNSKTFEKRMQSRVIAAARRHLDTVDDNMDDYEVLSQILIENYSQELAVKGDFDIELEGELIHLRYFPYGVVLNSRTLKAASVPKQRQIKKIVTVENKANFMSMPYEEGSLILFSHGYFSPVERDFLKVLEGSLKGETVEYYHTGDLDYGGVKIFEYIKNRIFPELKPLMMDTETFEQFREYGETIEESKLEKLKRTKEKTLQPLIDLICREKLVIEQESFLFRQQ